MRAESIAFAVAGTLFGVIMGWVLGSQYAASARVAPAAVAASAPAAPAAPAAGRPAPAALDEGRVKSLRAAVDRSPKDPQPRVDLGNAYFDAEQYDQAISWYESAISLNPADPNVSTDLGVAYYYTNQHDRAIERFEHSLSVDPKHTKTLLNMGIVKAFGKQDLAGAAKAWKEVVTIAPNSAEGQAARRALEGMQKAHVPGAGSSEE